MSHKDIIGLACLASLFILVFYAIYMEMTLIGKSKEEKHECRKRCTFVVICLVIIFMKLKKMYFTM